MTEVPRAQGLATVFWIAASLNLLFIAGWVLDFVQGNARGQADGLIFLFLIGVVVLLGGLMVVFARVYNPVFRGLALVVVAIPLLHRGVVFAKNQAETLASPSRASLLAGHGYFQSPADCALADAIVAGDARKVAELAPAANLKAVGFDGMTFLKLALHEQTATSPDVSVAPAWSSRRCSRRGQTPMKIGCSLAP